MELHVLSAVHSMAWVALLAKKTRAPPEELPRNCSRALVATLGFYLHDIWELRGTLIHRPLQMLHQASVALTVSSILRSKGVAWLAVPLMSQAIPNLLQELLQLCGTLSLPARRPEVR